MANPLRKTMVYLGLADEELEYDDDARRRPSRRSRRRPPAAPSKPRAPVTPLRQPAASQARRPAAEMNEILTVHPRQYRDAQVIAENFREGIPVIINLSQMSDADARRLIDFASGLSQGLYGKIERVTSKVFLLSPEHVAVSAASSGEVEADVEAVVLRAAVACSWRRHRLVAIDRLSSLLAALRLRACGRGSILDWMRALQPRLAPDGCRPGRSPRSSTRSPIRRSSSSGGSSRRCASAAIALDFGWSLDHAAVHRPAVRRARCFAVTSSDAPMPSHARRARDYAWLSTVGEHLAVAADIGTATEALERGDSHGADPGRRSQQAVPARPSSARDTTRTRSTTSSTRSSSSCAASTRRTRSCASASSPRDARINELQAAPQRRRRRSRAAAVAGPGRRSRARRRAPGAPSADRRVDDQASTNNLLQLARRLHEEHVREGIEKRDALIAEGHATAARVVAEAEAKQRAADRRPRAGARRRSSTASTSCAPSSATTARSCKSYIEGQLRDLERHRRARRAGAQPSPRPAPVERTGARRSRLASFQGFGGS